MTEGHRPKSDKPFDPATAIPPTGGTGTQKSNMIGWTKCLYCDGTGINPNQPGMSGGFTEVCRRCGGSGKTATYETLAKRVAAGYTATSMGCKVKPDPCPHCGEVDDNMGELYSNTRVNDFVAKATTLLEEFQKMTTWEKGNAIYPLVEPLTQTIMQEAKSYWALARRLDGE